MTESVHPVIAAAQRYRQALLNQERQSATRLVDAYGRAYARMGDSIRALEEKLFATAGGENADRVRLASLRSLRAQVVDEINRFAVYADEEITRNARTAIAQGITDSRQIVGAYFSSPQAQQALAAGWNVLPSDAVETMLGFLAEDSPLHTRLVGILGEQVAASMERNLVDAMALGFNPRKTADIVREELGVGLTWALNTARTAQLYSYREATRANYMANSDVISGWTWYSALDSRVCMSCISRHGTAYPVTATLNGHHSCRCVAIPISPLAQRIGITMPEIETGETWFNRQPEATQIEMMGPGMFDAWNANAFEFADLSQPYQDEVYGEMLREASLKDLLGVRAKEFYH